MDDNMTSNNTPDATPEAGELHGLSSLAAGLGCGAGMAVAAGNAAAAARRLREAAGIDVSGVGEVDPALTPPAILDPDR